MGQREFQAATADDRERLRAAVRFVAPPPIQTAVDVAPFPPATLTPEEAKAVESAVASRQAEFGAGRACARRALADLGVSVGSITVGPHREPQWPEQIAGSITHTKDAVVAAVARRSDIAGLGIDIEGREAVDPELRHRIATPAELSVMPSDPLEARRFLSWLFSAKESFYKCWFPLNGERPGFHDVEIDPVPVTTWTDAVADITGTFSIAGHPDLTGRFALTGPWVATSVVFFDRG